MASEPDDNPFARNSAWPKMPQAPMRVSIPPRTPEGRAEQPAAAPPPSDVPPQPRTITPLFVRPIEGPIGAELSGLITRPMTAPNPAQPPPAPDTTFQPSHPLPKAVDAPVVVARAPAAPSAPAPTPEPKPGFTEVEAVIVQPLRARKTKAAGRSKGPAIAAAVVAAAGVAGLIFMFASGQRAAPRAVAALPVAAAALTPTPPAATPAPVAATTSPTAGK